MLKPFRLFTVTDQSGMKGVGTYSSCSRRMRQYSVDWENNTMSNLSQEEIDKLQGFKWDDVKED